MRRLLGLGRGRWRPIVTAATTALTLGVLMPLIGASAASANGVALAKGDVLASVGEGTIRHLDSNGTLKDTLTTGLTGTLVGGGMCFDPAVNLYATEFKDETLSKFDSGGNLLTASLGSGFNEDPESCVVDASEHIYVGQADGSHEVLKFSTSGALLVSFAPEPESRGTDWVDLAPDQCTLHYTSEGNAIKAFNVCTNKQLPDFATGLPGPCYAHRILADGSELVACHTVVEHISSTGTIIQTYAPGGTELFALNLDPDGTSFWTADIFSGEIWKIDIASGAVLKTFNSGSTSGVTPGLAIVGERVCAESEIKLAPATAENPVDTTHTVTATVSECGVPQPGVTVTFTVAGANPQTGPGTTNAAGEATFTYLGKNAGTDTISASFVNKKGETEESNEVTKIWNDQPIAATGQNLSGTEGAVASGIVATFTDPDSSATASEYSATIEWGDGASSSGTVSGGSGSFSVSGSHTYADEGSYPIKVVITDVDNKANGATTTSTAMTGDAALSASGVSATSPMAFNGTVASLTDANTGGSAADFTATIEWGDGASSTGTVSGSGGSYAISGSHTYASTGFFEVTVKIVDDGGSTAEAKSRILIFASTAGGSFVIGDDDAAIGTPVTFWGAQWSKQNSLSGGAAPAAFKGFADAPASPPACGTSWSTSPGNSSGPPRGPLPEFIAVIVSSHITKSGATISGDTPEVVVVKTGSGYAPNPGHAGTGSVVARIC
jgi:hypothetical protein